MKEKRTNRVQVRMDRTEEIAIRAIAEREKMHINDLLRRAALDQCEDKKSVTILSDDLISLFVTCTDLEKTGEEFCKVAMEKAPLLRDAIRQTETSIEELRQAKNYAYRLTEKRRVTLAGLLHNHICRKQLEADKKKAKEKPCYWVDVFFTDTEYIQLLDKTTEEEAGAYLLQSVLGHFCVDEYVITCYSADDLVQQAKNAEEIAEGILKEAQTENVTQWSFDKMQMNLSGLIQTLSSLKISKDQNEQRRLISQITKAKFAERLKPKDIMPEDPEELREYLKATFGRKQEGPKHVSPWLKYLTPSADPHGEDQEIHEGEGEAPEEKESDTETES